MSSGEVESQGHDSQAERPRKKRRYFFADPTPSPEPEQPPGSPLTHEAPAAASQPPATVTAGQDVLPSRPALKFDGELFKSMFGDVSPQVLKTLADVSGGDTERAINMYLDGSWQSSAALASTAGNGVATELSTGPTQPGEKASSPMEPRRTGRLDDMPEHRYIGAFGVGVWSTKSGSGLLKHGQKIAVQRQKIQQKKIGKGGKAIPLRRQKGDIIVRVTNLRGDEIARFPEDTASWIAPLLDQEVCHFEGVCVYTPDRLHINDTVFVQLHCFMRKKVFQSKSVLQPLDDNRRTGLHEESETIEEQALRLRQFSLVKLFEEINLQPSLSNSAFEQEKRQGILKQTEEVEDKDGADKAQSSGDSPEHSSQSEPEEDGEELQQDQLDTLYKKAQSFDFNTPEMQPAETFKLSLRKYQKQALHWMFSKENDMKSNDREASMHPLWEQYNWPTRDVDDKELPTVEAQDHFYVNPYSGELSLDFPVQDQHCLGGILADEMGLGKTIEMLSLIHTNPSEAQNAASQSVPLSVNDLNRLSRRAGVQPAPYTTLVVAPMALLAQWESEAVKASEPGSLRTLLYYENRRGVDLSAICSSGNAASAPNLIITSYGTVLSEYTQISSRPDADRSAGGGLFSVDFHRIILDEAHWVKNRQSKTAKACYELAATHRWVLTGTPIVNRLEDLFSLVRFLRVEPWSNFSFWKTFITVPFEGKDIVRALNVVQTVLEPLVLRRTKDMKTPDGSALVPLPPRTIEIQELQLSKSEQEVYDWIFTRAKREFAANMAAGTLLKSYTTIFAQLLRLRQACCDPTLTRNKDIVEEEEEAAAAVDVANGLADDMDLNELITRFSVESEYGSSEEQDVANKFGVHVLKQIQDEVDTECPICTEEPMIEPVVTGCWHSACKNCLLDYIKHQTDKSELPRCVSCREAINSRDLFEVIRHDEVGEPDSSFKPNEDEDDDLYASTPKPSSSSKRITLRRVSASGSAKVLALLTHLKRLRREDPAAKCVVFSQFTSFLDIVGSALDRDGIGFLRFDGTTSQKERARVLAQFEIPNGQRDERGRRGAGVLLISLRAGGVGLNLTMAREVFVLDPWWSWAVEAQAIDRVHRMGQTAAVRVTRFIVAGSVEQRMLKVQDRKKFIASSLGMVSEEERRMQRIEDIKELLS